MTRAIYSVIFLVFATILAGCGTPGPPRVTSSATAAMPSRQVPVKILLKTDKPKQYVPVNTVLGTTYENIPARTVEIGLESLRPVFPNIQPWTENAGAAPVLLVSLQASGHQGFGGTKTEAAVRATLYDREGRPYDMFRGRGKAESGSSHARVVYSTHKTALKAAYRQMAADLLNWRGLDYFIKENQ